MPLLAAAQALGILLAERGLLAPRIAAATAAVALAAAVATRRRALRLGLAAVLACAAGGAALGRQLDAARRDRPEASFEAVLEGRVTRVERLPGRVWVELDAVASAAAVPRVPRRVRVSERAGPERREPALGLALPGDRLRLAARLRAPRSLANPGGRSRERELARRGVGATGTLVHAELVVRRPDAEGVRPLRALHRVRAESVQRLLRAGSGGGLLAALGLGDRSGLSRETRHAFQQLGVGHLLSVSGLHLALVAGIAFGLVQRTLLALPRLAVRRDPRRPALAASVGLAVGYAFLSGWGVPARRALVLLLALALAVAARRPVSWVPALAAGAVAILAVEPAALFDPGAQMSFAASAALCRAARRGGATARSGGEARVRDLLRTSAAALAATSPLVALHGGVVSPWALAANLVLIPWTGFVLLPAAIGATLVVAVARDDAPGPALALAAAERVAAGTIALLEGAAALLPELPAHRPRPAAWIAAVALAGVAIEARRALVQVGGALAVVALLALAPPAPIRPAPPRVVFLDVGLGDAVLVQGRRAAVLVDAGTALPDGPDLGAFEVVPALAALGVRRLDVVIVSHADLDHRGGVPSVLRAVPVGAVWIPRDASQDPALAPVLATARERGTPVREQGAGDAETRVGDVRVRPLWPPPACSGRLSRNDCSLVVRVEAGEGSVLLTGDLERDGETALLGRGGAALRADVLKLSHHGSASSSVDAFLVGVAGRVAVASAPWERRSPLPHPDVRVRAARAGYALWWTGRDGAVLVGLGGPIEVRPLREAGQTRNELE